MQMLPWINAIVALPSVRPSTISSRAITGAMGPSACVRPFQLSRRARTQAGRRMSVSGQPRPVSSGIQHPLDGSGSKGNVLDDRPVRHPGHASHQPRRRTPPREPWNKGKLIGQKPALRAKDVWSIRTRLQMEGRTRDLAMFNLAIDSKMRGCDVVALRVEDVAPSGYAVDRATVRRRRPAGQSGLN
jgi:hypothetical protein